ncbi:hypothetical protein [Alkalicoccus luteus]|uniref:Uncharacterized protein n=1 Tax=Alkalicoccus luteus TaxID=1237094 RepID=A0A969PPB9_9BACI|nr:hypothetical protein [Alkalicoccus luteus]NJP37902.1 hypothetical protein [Alkalicoccus luteus]
MRPGTELKSVLNNAAETVAEQARSNKPTITPTAGTLNPEAETLHANTGWLSSVMKEAVHNQDPWALVNANLDLYKARQDRNRSNEALEQLQHDYKDLEDQLEQANQEYQKAEEARQRLFDKCEALETEKESLLHCKASYYDLEKSFERLELENTELRKRLCDFKSPAHQKIQKYEKLLLRAHMDAEKELDELFGEA